MMKQNLLLMLLQIHARQSNKVTRFKQKKE
jgi:hypothetical protein